MSTATTPPRRPHLRPAATACSGGQLDISARIIWLLEKFGWVSDVRWTNPARLARITKDRTAHNDARTEELTP
jgi:hypothetical protein